MQWHSSRTKGVAIVLAGCLPLSAGFIPGVPDLVWDPIQSGHMAQALAHDLQNIALIARQLEIMEMNTRAFSSRVKGRFRGFTQPFYRPSTGNIFGETAVWADTVGGGLHTYQQTQDAWKQSSTPLAPSPLLRNQLLKSTGLSKTLNRLANVEISDAAAVNALQTNNAVRAQQTLNESAIRSLQENCLYGTNDSDAEQSNCASGAGILNVQSVQTTNALLSSVVDLNVAQLKHTRDQEAQRVNRESRVLEYQATEQTNAVFSPDAMRRFKFKF